MYKMKIELGLFKDFIMISDFFVDELKLKITKNKIEYIVVDAAHVVMGNCEIRKGAFESYDVEKNIIIVVEMQQLKSILKLGKSKDIINIFGDNIKMTITINNSVNDLTLLEPKSDVKIPTLSFYNNIKINTRLFAQILSRCSDVSDCVKLNINENGFRIFASGDVNKIDSKIHKSKLVNHRCSDESLGQYSLSYIYPVAKSIPTKDISIYISGVDYPLKIEFDKPYMSGFILLAPRIEDDNTTIPKDHAEDYEQDKNLNNDALW